MVGNHCSTHFSSKQSTCTFRANVNIDNLRNIVHTNCCCLWSIHFFAEDWGNSFSEHFNCSFFNFIWLKLTILRWSYSRFFSRNLNVHCVCQNNCRSREVFLTMSNIFSYFFMTTKKQSSSSFLANIFNVWRWGGFKAKYNLKSQNKARKFFKGQFVNWKKFVYIFSRPFF